jgi:hypothetical protein
MATFLGLIDFTNGPGDVATTASPGTFTEDGITFTFSVTNGFGPAPTANFVPAFGRVSMSEPSFSDATLTIAISNVGGFSKFSTNFTINASSVAGTWLVSNGFGGIGHLSPGNLSTVAFVNSSQIKFINVSLSGPTRLTLDTLYGRINCFCTGTAIATVDGTRAVETLVSGDRILTANGDETEVKWLGRQPIDVRLCHPAKINPICISAGALADAVPLRDLWVSQEHAVEIDGMLINAGALVNGHSIYQVRDMPLEGFSYYHVETDGHELLLAEGVAAESYLDMPDRSAFMNGAERAGVPPIAEMDLPRISTPRLVPPGLRARLLARANVPEAA